MIIEDFNELISQIYNKQSKNGHFESQYFEIKKKILNQRQ